MNTPTETQRYQVDQHARFRVLEDEGIFVLQEAGEVLVINEVGALIVERLRENETLADAVKAVTTHYQVDEDTARSDAEQLIDALLEAGALTRS